MSKTAVVILNWNGKRFLEQFLPGVVSYSEPAEVVLADNCSTDDSVSYVRENFTSVSIIINDSNGGFSKGYNDALRKVDAKYYVLLNSDVEVTPNWLNPLVALMDTDPTIAACQPKILAFNRRTEFEYAGAAGGYIDKFGYPFCRGRIFDSFETDHGQYDDTREIHWATGACLVVRADAYHKVGGLDEDFFAHMEEIDLCWRLKNIGYKVMYCAQSTVYHVGAGTLSKASPRKTYLNFRNNLILLCKNHAHQFFWLKLFLRMAMDGLAGIKFIFSGDFSHCWAVFRAHLSFYRTFNVTLDKRKKLKALVKQYSTTAIYNHSIVAEYFFRKKKKFSDLNQGDFL